MEKVTLSGMLFAIGLILPFFIGQIPAVGKMLLPMHIPVLYPNAIAMAFEMAPTDSSPDGFTATQNGSGRKNGTRSRAEMSITSGSNRKSLCRSKRAKRCSTAPIIRRNGASLRQQKSRRAASISWRERTPAMNGWKHTTI